LLSDASPQDVGAGADADQRVALDDGQMVDSLLDHAVQRRLQRLAWLGRDDFGRMNVTGNPATTVTLAAKQRSSMALALNASGGSGTAQLDAVPVLAEHVVDFLR
jgi:hypothetical protein